MEKTILITNDDGINAKGIAALVDVMRSFGRVVVVAPGSPQSAKGHGITITEPLRMRKVDLFGEEVDAYETSGTPADCVKLAKAVIFKDRQPDLCVSGINHGSNAAINIVYSGTVSGAMEAALEGIDSVAFSLLNWSHDADFTACKPFVKQVVENVLEQGLEGKTMLNVNIPNLPESEIKGLKVVRQADSKWVEEFEERLDPHGNTYYWLTGKFVNLDNGEDTDEYHLENGYVTIVPVHADHTAHHVMDNIKNRF
jgi:5'-nucleotidase